MQYSYRESLEYLYGLQFFGIKLGLENIRTLLRRVGNPQNSLRIVHIAGTNGKGSTAATLAAILHAAGVSAGLYTSPHLHHFTERIRINAQPIEENEALQLIEELRPHAEELQATFFEVTTAMALLSFQRHRVEWAILETGMGGRLDATNIVQPEVCLITSIGLDHTAYLGATLTQIAEEKAGIFKVGVPVVSVEQAPEVAEVLTDRAAELSAPLKLEKRDYDWQEQDSVFSYSDHSMRLDKAELKLLGDNQRRNAALAVAAVSLLNESGMKIDHKSIRKGLESVVWPGRLEWLPERVLVDGAHNPAGAETLAGYLKRANLDAVHLVIGCKRDKAYVEILRPLLPFACRVYASHIPVEDSLEPEKLMQQAEGSGILASAHGEPREALNAAFQRRRQDEVVVVAGSLFLVASVREILLTATDTPAIML
ncbi:MAG: bifunctional folylpolyglutamate synthase/dihydrofolate synthase [Desulfuromonadales bacterium]|nr:bifunctional folylpolyglutamate synthase/dihydrofolate synthase [Desulfuromonadales bacterium]MBN2792288.1 bifunctional folylpolyglutamate synthase/dihydrofolate synthase [Desulfuromonadales bacterium]